MKVKIFLSMAIIALMCISTVAVGVPGMISPNTPNITVDPMLIDEQVRHRINTASLSTDFSDVVSDNSGAKVNSKMMSSTQLTSSSINDQKYFLILDDYYGTYRLSLFTLYSQGSVGEVWVQNNRNWPTGSGRDNNQHIITTAQTDYLLSEFENNIYAKEASFYGAPFYQDGSNSVLGAAFGFSSNDELCAALGRPSSYCDYSDSNGRTAILVENVRDANYYIPGYPVYIAGFYSSTLDFYFDRNMMTIDSYDWINRVGPNGNRPYLYEMTFAHEYQHLIHADYVPGDTTFINEGFSMYAEYLTGYGVDYGYVNAYFAQPQNSLTEWGDLGDINILGDYGAAMLFTHYIENHYPGFQTTYMNNGISGISGLEQAIADVMGHKPHSHHQVTFDQLYSNWHLANLLQAKWGPYSYSTIDFSKANPLTMQSFIDNAASGNSYSYSTYYFLLDGLKGPYKLNFNGDTNSYVVPDPGWTLGSDGYWFSGFGDLIDRSIVGSAYVDPSNPYLSFYTEYDIEEGWDFGIVQASNDNGASWTSLSNEYTTSDNQGTYPAIIDQLPGITGAGATTMSFDLSSYIGQNILIRFRYMTDWATNGNGWYIDSSSVDISGVHVDLTTMPPPPPPTVNWEVTLVEGIHTQKGDQFLFIRDMCINSKTADGSTILTFFSNKEISNFVFILVTPVMSSGNAGFQMNLDKFNHNQHF